MWRRLLVMAAAVGAILVLGAGIPPRPGSSTGLASVAAEMTPVELEAFAYENGCLMPSADETDAGPKPSRTIADAYPNFLGVAVDPDNGRVVMSDSGLKGLIMYDRAGGTRPGVDQVTTPLAELRGSKTEIGFVAGVALDRARKEKYTVNNDGGDKVVVFDYDATGNVTPKRELMVTHQAWGIALDQARDEMAVTVEINNWIEFDRTAHGDVAPRTIIRGKNTRITRLRQIEVDPERGLLFVASRGDREGEGILGVWNITDNGDVPPRLAIVTAAAGVAINPRAAEIFTASGRTNDLRTYIIPELFKGPARTAGVDRPAGR